MQYNPVLEEIGISEEAFEAMPLEKKAFYQGFRSIIDSVSDVRYFKEVGVLGVDGTIEYTLVETTKDAYENRSEESMIQPYSKNPDSISEKWCTMTTTITKGSMVSGRISYVVKNEVDLDIEKMGGLLDPVINRTALVAISLNSNMSPVAGSEVFHLEYKHLTGPDAGTMGDEYVWNAQHKTSIGYAFDFCVENSKRMHKVTMMYGAISNTSSDVSVVDAFGSACFWKKVIKINSVTFGPSGVEKISVSPNVECVFAKNTHAQLP